jgi:hypothetical protein
MNSSFKSLLIKNLSNLPGWNTNRHLIVIESDDWGSIRMPSTDCFDKLMKNGIDLLSDEGYRFNKYDTLASEEDLALLFEVLSSVMDSTGRPAVLTPVSVVANPDFEKIEEADFSEYFYEPFTRTQQKYQLGDNVFQLWKEGIRNRIFVPQFHGREHLNVKVWLRTLKGRHKNTLQAFKNKMWGISTANDPDIRVEFQAAFDLVDVNDLNYQARVISSGLDLFEETFGYRAEFFVPPNGPFNSDLEATCYTSGIKYLSTSKVHIEPLGNNRIRKRYHWLGKKSKNGITYLTRNCFFEPSSAGKDWVNSCLDDISFAFKWKKPAVISSHRVNFIGSLYPENRNQGLEQLSLLLNTIVKRWPDTEFVTSAELGNILAND